MGQRVREPSRPGYLPAPLPRAAAVTALAAGVDYLLVPRRFTPGFEAHLPRTSIVLVYVAFAAGLVLPEWLSRPPLPRSTANRRDTRNR